MFKVACTCKIKIFSQKYVLPEGNYTLVSIAAVDLCGKRSNLVQVQLINTATVNTCAPNFARDAIHAQQNEAAITGGVLGVLLLIFVVIAAALLVAVIILAYRCEKSKPKRKDVELNEKNTQSISDIAASNDNGTAC